MKSVAIFFTMKKIVLHMEEVTFEWSFPEHACLANEKRKNENISALFL